MITITDGNKTIQLSKADLNVIINSLYDSKIFMSRYNSTLAQKELEKTDHLLDIFYSLEVE